MEHASADMTPTTTRLRELYDYDPATGRFTRRTGPKAGKLVRKSRGKKPVRVKIDDKTYLAAECAFLWMTGEWPTHRVIHKDGNVKNDCWANLELEDKSGVYHDEAQDKWCAMVGRDRFWFDTAEEAYAALRPSSTRGDIQEELSKLGLI
jgi:hypothetical protein